MMMRMMMVILMKRTYLPRAAGRLMLNHRKISSSSLDTAAAAAAANTTSNPEFYRRQNRDLSLLIRAGRLWEARRVFDGLPRRNVVTWNSMIGGYVRCGEVGRARQLFGEMPERDVVSWNSMLLGCTLSGEVDEGRRLFDMMPERDAVSWNTMITGYARCGRMADAERLFEGMPGRNAVSWNTMLTGFLENGDVARAVEMFDMMPVRDAGSLSALMSGLVRNGRLEDAESVLLKISRERVGEMEGVVDAYNTLIAGYGQSGKVGEARHLFDSIPHRHDCRGGTKDGDVKSSGSSRRKRSFERNVVSWNSMIMCYLKVRDLCSARRLFDEMPERDQFSWNTMISGYVHADDLEEAASLFQEMPDPDARSWNFMILGFAQKGEVERARDYFDRTPHKSLVSWNTMIAGYEQNGDYGGATELFSLMLAEGERPDRHTLSSMLSACTGLAALYQGVQIHQLITKTIVADIPINNALITMYSRCGNVTDARAVFDTTKLQRDVVSWNAMIGGYAQHGLAAESLKLFEEMKRMKVRPTHITFISILNACGHAGFVAEGQRQFDSMLQEFGIMPCVEHYASLVDLIGRHGELEDAMDVIDSMLVTPDRAVWGALLGACRVHNNVDLARVAAEALVGIEPDSSAPYVLLYNMYADMGRWNDAMEVREMMDRNGIRKQPGYSWIELQKNVHLFIAGDRSHPLAHEIHSLIESCNRLIRDEYCGCS